MPPIALNIRPAAGPTLQDLHKELGALTRKWTKARDKHFWNHCRHMSRDQLAAIDWPSIPDVWEPLQKLRDAQAQVKQIKASLHVGRGY